MYHLIVVVAVLVLLITLWWFRRPKVNLGFCSADAPYVKPVVIENLITPNESEYILESAKSKFNDSTILSGKDDSIRKSETAWLGKNDPVVETIFKRFSEQFNFDVSHVEDLQVVRYAPGGFYNDHHDSCCDDTQHCQDFVRKSGQRVLTILIYLNDEFEGGYTNFKNLNLNLKASPLGGIVFHPLQLGGGNFCHPNALHKGTPVTSGVKYICNVWVRERPF
jgi:prolyl 4-hydroxylase